MKKKKESEKDNSERWLLSYADFITLLMVFFIIMYSMSVVNQEKFQALAESLSSSMSGGGGGGDGPGGGYLAPPDITPDPGGDDDAAADAADQAALENTEALIQQYLDDAGLQDSVSLRVDERGLVVILADTTTFDSGSTDILEDFVPNLVQIADILSKIDNYVRIEGHTDNVPISSTLYASNWELSTARATSLVELFIAQSDIAPDKLSATGYGEYRPVAPNDTEDGRAQNRRVEIVVLRSKFNASEAAGN